METLQKCGRPIAELLMMDWRTTEFIDKRCRKGKCAGCGFSADEQKRRLETGEWKVNAQDKRYLSFKAVSV